jgi:hypothetical protein
MVHTAGRAGSGFRLLHKQVAGVRNKRWITVNQNSDPGNGGLSLGEVVYCFGRTVKGSLENSSPGVDWRNGDLEDILGG